MESVIVDQNNNGHKDVELLVPKVMQKPAGNKSTLGLKFATAAVVLAAGIGGYLYLTNGEVTTDDASIEGHIVFVSPKVSGYISRVLVDDNQPVEKGHFLAEIESDDYVTRRDRELAKVAGAEARLKESQDDLARYQALAANDETTQQTLGNAEAAAESTQADLSAAQADLRQAELNLSYTQVVAPQAGRVTRKSLEEGAFVNRGQAVLAIVPSDVWVIANFKETELRGMKPGQRAEISVDVSSTKLTGRVDSIQSGTGARFSLFPPENATGNYVKVVQRVPVKIVLDNLDQAGLLAPGLSVEATVAVK